MDKGAIGFPEIEENPKFENKQNRQPVFLPSMCPTNELYYPGDQQYDWICDCRPGYLYHPATDACWLAYQRGPCPKGQYLVLPKTSVIPVCEINPCIGDNLVMWHEKCETLGSFTPCGKTYPASALWVNATTITIDCVKIYMEIEPRFSQDNIGEQVLCPPGCKRSIKSQCVPGPRS
ncbi:unnamed protein product [Parnassius apollo]|uniref:(apollo) hypothetical protein n=1 Tax=Parnassius apollo TaxID=110799 RepID=A0A8S3W0F1_PARAO|nr:unnamed protein product [Parnassius apollo]